MAIIRAAGAASQIATMVWILWEASHRARNPGGRREPDHRPGRHRWYGGMGEGRRCWGGKP